MEQSITQYVFKPKPDIADWIDENISSWTQFCYDNIYHLQKKNHYDRFDKLSNKFAFVLFGCILLGLTYIIPNVASWLVFFCCGLSFLIIGFISIYWEVRNGRKQRV